MSFFLFLIKVKCLAQDYGYEIILESIFVPNFLLDDILKSCTIQERNVSEAIVFLSMHLQDHPLQLLLLKEN